MFRSLDMLVRVNYLCNHLRKRNWKMRNKNNTMLEHGVGTNNITFSNDWITFNTDNTAVHGQNIALQLCRAQQGIQNISAHSTKKTRFDRQSRLLNLFILSVSTTWITESGLAQNNQHHPSCNESSTVAKQRKQFRTIASICL